MPRSGYTVTSRGTGGGKSADTHGSGLLTIFATIVFLTGIGTGLLIWVAALPLTGKVEPWHSEFYLWIVLPMAICGAITIQRPTSMIVFAIFGLWIGQLLAVFFLPQFEDQRRWPIIIPFTTYIGAIFGSLGMYVGWGIRRLILMFIRR